MRARTSRSAGDAAAFQLWGEGAAKIEQVDAAQRVLAPATRSRLDVALSQDTSPRDWPTTIRGAWTRG